MKRIAYNLFLISFIFCFSACSDTNSENTSEISDQNQEMIDDESAMDMEDKEINVAKEAAESEIEMEEEVEDISEEEEGLSFCDCVKMQKKLEAIMLETEDDDEFDEAMEKMESLKTGECKVLFEGNQSTIEQKKAHENKVKRCL